eukprot:2817688-Pyramimonas_sp.AAC.1
MGSVCGGAACRQSTCGTSPSAATCPPDVWSGACVRACGRVCADLCTPYRAQTIRVHEGPAGGCSAVA